jgi:hypothetical protein
MKLSDLSPATQDGLRLWSKWMWGDSMALDDINGIPAGWAWVWFLLREAEDRPEWFPKGKSATLQIIEGKLIEEAKATEPVHTP